jgi:hypothetical protein
LIHLFPLAIESGTVWWFHSFHCSCATDDPLARTQTNFKNPGIEII